jgi:DNA invertase Pin-like site-specific DNA recombinase
MLKKAAKGKIDYIITKSISRVSRDTVEVLKIVRYLRERSINMYCGVHLMSPKACSIMDSDRKNILKRVKQLSPIFGG